MNFWRYYWDKEDDMDAPVKPSKPRKTITLINPEGEILFEDVPTFYAQRYLKKKYSLPNSKVKYVWRKTLEEKGYKILNNKDGR